MGLLVCQKAGTNLAPSSYSEADLQKIKEPIFNREQWNYGYDAALNMVSANDSTQTVRYEVNGNAQVTAVKDQHFSTEKYDYNACGYVENSLNKQSEIYDNAGRLISKITCMNGFKPEKMLFEWNSQDQLVVLKKQNGDIWHYTYDPLGRRTQKRCDQQNICIQYLWDGNTIAEIRDYKADKLQRIRHWVFDGFDLISQQEQAFDYKMLDAKTNGKISLLKTHYAVTAPTCEPLALFDPQGEKIWHQPKTSLWGVNLKLDTDYKNLDPSLKFAGQIIDT